MKRKSIYIVAIVVFVAIIFNIYRNYKSDETRSIRKFIDVHNTGTVYYPPSGFGGLSYKNINISDTEIKGIGYYHNNSTDICLYSQKTERTYVEYFGWIYYIVYCQITFEWNDFGNKSFCAYVGFAAQERPESIQASLVVENFVYQGKPHFEDASVLRGRTEIKNDQMKTIARLQANNLIWDANSFLKTQDLPSLY